MFNLKNDEYEEKSTSTLSTWLNRRIEKVPDMPLSDSGMAQETISTATYSKIKGHDKLWPRDEYETQNEWFKKIIIKC